MISHFPHGCLAYQGVCCEKIFFCRGLGEVYVLGLDLHELQEVNEDNSETGDFLNVNIGNDKNEDHGTIESEEPFFPLPTIALELNANLENPMINNSDSA